MNISLSALLATLSRGPLDCSRLGHLLGGVRGLQTDQLGRQEHAALRDDPRDVLGRGHVERRVPATNTCRDITGVRWD